MGYESASHRNTSLQCNCCINKILPSLKINHGALQENVCILCVQKNQGLYCGHNVQWQCVSLSDNFPTCWLSEWTQTKRMCRKSTRCPWNQHLNRLLEYFSAVCVVSLGAAYKAYVVFEEVSWLGGIWEKWPWQKDILCPCELGTENQLKKKYLSSVIGWPRMNI